MSFYLYIRVSTEEQDPLAQRLEAENFIKKYPQFNITKVYEDRCSAWSSKPENLVNLINDISMIPYGNRPYILVKSVDRFSRNIDYGTQCINQIINLGTEIMFFDTPTLNVKTPEGRSNFDFLLQQAQNYSDIQSSKIKDAIHARKEAGLATTKIPVFGTRHVYRDDGRLYVEIMPQEYVVQALIAVLNGNYTIDQFMRCFRVYEASFDIPHTEKTIYDHDYRDYNERHKMFYAFGNPDEEFAEILNYLDVFKRFENWTKNSINYQWKKYIEPNLKDFENYIQIMLQQDVPDELLVKNVNHQVLSNEDDAFLEQ